MLLWYLGTRDRFPKERMRTRTNKGVERGCQGGRKKFVFYDTLSDDDTGNWWPTKLGQSEVSRVWWREKVRQRGGEQSVLLLPLVLRSCYVACLSGRLADKERLWDDSMVPEKQRGCPLESGRKGGRNKSSASNRGRASARFYSRTLNSIAIGFSGCLVERTLHRVLFRFLATSPRSPPPLSLSVPLLDHLYRGTPRWFLTRGNLITDDTIKYPRDEGNRCSSAGTTMNSDRAQWVGTIQLGLYPEQ